MSTVRICEGPPLHGGIAQLGEHLLCKQGVSGSNPLISTTTGRQRESLRKVLSAALVHALEWGPGIRYALAFGSIPNVHDYKKRPGRVANDLLGDS